MASVISLFFDGFSDGNFHSDRTTRFVISSFCFSQVAVYMKSCNMALWTFTGLESAEPICCHEGKAIICDNAMSMIEN